MSKKLNVSIEELIHIATSAIYDTPKNHADRFIQDLNIETGNGRPGERVKSLVIYLIYKKWCKSNRRKPLKRITFFRQFKQHFKVKIIRMSYVKTSNRFYCIKESPIFRLSKEEIRQEEMNLRDERERTKRTLESRRRNVEKKKTRSEESGFE